MTTAIRRREVIILSIGANLKRLRTEKGMSQEELACSVHVTQSMIAQIERGTKALTVELAKEVLAVLGATMDDIWDDAG